MMRLLAIDAASSGGTVAVVVGGHLVAERAVEMRAARKESLMPAVADALREAGIPPRRLDAVICGEGPGSFTSLRIAAATAKGIVAAIPCPLFTVSSLDLIAAAARPALERGRYLAVLDAMRGESYTRLVICADGGGVTEGGPIVLLPNEDVPGEAERAGARPIGPAQPGTLLPHARGVVPMLHALMERGPVSAAEWEPLYGRPAEAQARWEAAHGRPLPSG